MAPTKAAIFVPRGFTVGAAPSTEAGHAVGEHGGTGRAPALGSAGQGWVVRAARWGAARQPCLFIVLSRILRLPYQILRASRPR